MDDAVLVTLISEDDVEGIQIGCATELESVPYELLPATKSGLWSRGQAVPSVAWAVMCDAKHCLAYLMDLGFTCELANGQSLLALAIQNKAFNAAEYLLENGRVDPSACDNEGKAPIHVAAELGNISILRLLISTGKVDINSRDSHGMTPLLYSIKPTTINVLRYLSGIDGIDMNCRTDQSQNIVNLAVAANRPDVIDFLLKSDKEIDFDNKDTSENTPLFAACQNDLPEIVDLLVNSGKISVNERCKGGRTAIFAAAQRSNRSLETLLSCDRTEVNVQDEGLTTPLHMAVAFQRKEAVAMLLNRKDIQPDLVDKDGRNPLFFAAKANDVSVMSMLLSDPDVSVDPSEVDIANLLDQYEYCLDLIRVLVLRGVPPDQPDSKGVSFLFIGPSLQSQSRTEEPKSFELSWQKGRSI